MFDANMRYLPKGHTFFAEFRGVATSHPLKDFSLTHKVILAEMLSDEHEDPTIRFFLMDDYIDISDSKSGLDTWIVYAGNANGTGFINLDIKAEAARRIEW